MSKERYKRGDKVQCRFWGTWLDDCVYLGQFRNRLWIYWEDASTYHFETLYPYQVRPSPASSTDDKSDRDRTLAGLPALCAVEMERIRQNAKWGQQDHDDLKWLCILMEEVGEAAEMINEDTPTGERRYSRNEIAENLEYELVEVAAVALAWIECMGRRKANP